MREESWETVQSVLTSSAPSLMKPTEKLPLSLKINPSLLIEGGKKTTQIILNISKVNKPFTTFLSDSGGH